jgi:NADP-dependent alcohol dehydrogenase
VPLGVVLTIPATGSESNMGAVISRAATQEKRVFKSPAVQPRFAVMDPDVILSLPERQVINGLVDAFVHVCEQYLTYPCEAPVQDGYAETLLRTLVELAADFSNCRRYPWRANLMWAANQALNGLIGLGVPRDFATHMIGHELTALFGIDHARTLAAVQPSLLRSQIRVKRAKLEQMGRRVFLLPAGDGLAERTIRAIEAMYHSLGVSTRLSDYGVTSAHDMDRVVARLKEHGMDRLGEHGAVTPEVSARILAAAL